MQRNRERKKRDNAHPSKGADIRALYPYPSSVRFDNLLDQRQPKPCPTNATCLPVRVLRTEAGSFAHHPFGWAALFRLIALLKGSNGCAKSRRKEMTDLRGAFCPRAFSMSTSRRVRVSLLSAGVREGAILRLPIFARRSGKNSPDSPLSYPPERRVFPCGVPVRDGADDAKDKQRSPKPCTNLCPQGRFRNPPIVCPAFTARFISTWWIWVGLANTTPAVGSR